MSENNNAGTPSFGSSAAEVRQALDNMRKDMSETVDELVGRVSPSAKAQELKDKVGEAAAGLSERFSDVTESVRESWSEAVADAPEYLSQAASTAQETVVDFGEKLVAGEKDAIKKAAIAGGVVAGVVAVIALIVVLAKRD